MPGARTRPLLAALLICLPLTAAAAGCSSTNINGNCNGVGGSNSVSCVQSEGSAAGPAAPGTSLAVVPASSGQGPAEQATPTAASAVSQGNLPPVNASVPSIPVASSGPGWYLYTGDGNPAPVHLTGTPSSTWPHWATSSVPAEIHITPATIDGTPYNYGTIMVGDGPIPAPYGSYEGEDYPGWTWDAKAVQLTWANLNNKNTVITQVVAQTTTYVRVLRGVSGAYAPTCLSFIIGSGITANWLELNSADNWVPVTTCE
jgi:hypothetical protein